MDLTPKQKMLSGAHYHPDDPELHADHHSAKLWMQRYNASLTEPPSVRRELLRERFATVGEGAVVRPPFHCDYGLHISLGAHVFLNFGCVILDCAPVSIGDRTQIGAVHLATSLVADLQLIAAGVVWVWADEISKAGITAESTASVVSLSGGALLANLVSVVLLVTETVTFHRG